MRKCLFALILATSLGAGEAAANCLSSQQTRTAIANGQARALGSLGIKGQIVSAKLCTGGRGLVYVLSVLRKGQVRTVKVDAKTGRRL
ncbi:PepSY domain-containing protein [Flexibacterium corallicola]|uniref:PepSY domain-containing protein n=1 Tax=Flexibacterium corallicola TaxID=3037259 RepID=UPI00286FA543|nr:hypothetical protein [Pseudovibrio sp. M1P-2-3]